MERVEVVVLEDAAGSPAAVEGATERGEGGTGITSERQNTGLVVKIPTRCNVPGAKDLLPDSECTSIPTQRFVVLALLVVMKSERFNDPRHIHVPGTVGLLGNLQSAVERGTSALHITAIVQQQRVRSQNPHEIGMIRPQGALADRQRAFESFAGIFEVPFSSIEHRQLCQWRNQVGMVGPEGALLDLDRALEQGSRLVEAERSVITAAKGIEEPTEDRMIGREISLVQIQSMFKERLGRVVLRHVHVHHCVGPGRVDDNRVVLQADGTQYLQRALEGRARIAEITNAQARPTGEAETRSHRPVVGAQSLLVDRHRPLEE